MPAGENGWRRPFEDPLQLPDGRSLVTLKDAADFIMVLPKSEQKHEKVQNTVEVLIMAAVGREPVMRVARRSHWTIISKEFALPKDPRLTRE